MANISKAVESELHGTRTSKKSFDPVEMMEVRRAVMAGDETVKVRGRTFSLRYEGHSVFYRPVDGFVPCGWLSVKRVENYFEDQE